MRKRDARPWQERERELIDRLLRWCWLSSPRIERAKRLWRFWHRDTSRWVVFAPKGKVCFGPGSRREAERAAMQRYEADRKANEAGRRARPMPYYIQEVFG